MAIRIRKIGHSHKLTVPTTRKGLGIAEAARQVAKNKGATVEHPGAGYGPYDTGDQFKSGGTIHINPKNKGKFNALKKRTGKSTEQLTHSSNPLTRKRAVFAQNAKHWKHADGGIIEEYKLGGAIVAARKKPGGSNAGKYKGVHSFAGPSGGAPAGSYPINSLHRAKSALKLAHHAPNPAGIKAAVYRKYPQLKHAEGGLIGDPKLNVQNNNLIPLTERQFYDLAVKPTNDTLSLQQYNQVAPQDRFKYLPQGGNFSMEQGAKGSTANKGYMKYYQNVPKQMGPQNSLTMRQTAIIPPYAQGGYTRAGGWSVGPGHDMRKLGYSAGQMIGGNQNYPGIQQFPPEYSFGGVLKAVSPFAPLLAAIPGVGPIAALGIKGAGMAMGIAGGAMDQNGQNKDLEEQKRQQAIAQANNGQAGITNQFGQTFAWGGRLPETRTGGYGPSGLTLGHIPGVITDRGFNYTSGHGPSVNEGSPWQRQTMSNVRNHRYAFGGQTDPTMGQVANQYEDAQGGTPAELEGAPQGEQQGEVFQTPQGEMGQVNGPSHDQGGVDMNLPPETFVWSARLKSRQPQFAGKTFAEVAAKLGRDKAKYEKILQG
jgi:hypothetical protein